MPYETDTETHAVDLLRRAKTGDTHAKENLLGWAYETAHEYYRRKTAIESALTHADAEDLASAFYLEFARAWPRIEAVYHYTRRMLKNNLRRHLLRARSRRSREAPLSQHDLVRRFEGRCVARQYDAGWSDGDWLKHHVIGQVIASADPRTQELVGFRCADPALPYREISKRTGASEAALRMRMARFYDAVRTAHAQACANRSQREWANRESGRG